MRIKDTLWAWREELILLVLISLVVICSQLLPDVLLPFMVSFVLAYVFIPVVRFLEKGFHRITRREDELRAYAVTFFFLTSFLVFLLALIPMIFALIAELHDISEVLGGAGVQRYAERAGDFVDGLKEKALSFPYLNESVKMLQASREKIVESVTRTLGEVGAGLKIFFAATARGLLASLGQAFNFALVPVLLFYMLLDWERIVRIGFLLIPESYAPWTRAFAEKVDNTLRNYIKGQMLIAMIFGLLMTIGLSVIGVRYALIIGPVAGFSNLIPYLGVVVGLVPSILLTFLDHGWSAAAFQGLLGILVVYIIIQTIDGYVLQPRITAKLVNLHPLLVILALVVGGKLMGLYGLLLAVPGAAILKELFHDVYHRLYGRRWPFAVDPAEQP